ncbi:MAG: peptidylprolyl isomerase [Venatoribacter sp.]
MTDLAIAKGSKITLHFALKMEDGRVVDSNFEGSPASCVVGDDNIPEGFAEYLIGLKVGDHKEFVVPPEKGFNVHQSANQHVMPRSVFPVDMPIAPGLVVSFADAKKDEVPGVVKEVEGDWVTIDFNHPLSGQTLIFEVKILEVSDAN